MTLTGNLKDVIKQQKKNLAELENEFLKIEENDLTQENDKLNHQLDNLKATNVSDKEIIKTITDENAGLRASLYQQIYKEKHSIINMTEKKLSLYFKTNYDRELNRLNQLEQNTMKRINGMSAALAQNNINANDELFSQLKNLSFLLNEKIAFAKNEQYNLHRSFTEQEKEAFATLKNEPISESTMKTMIKKNNIENFIGLNLINKLGILLIIIGVIVASQYTYMQLSDYLKGALIFGLGGIMLLIGEILNRKKPNTFSLGITAGGIAIVYIALVASHFGLQILSVYPALIICILITSVAFLLATRYNAQVILAFALVGAYLPMFSIGNSDILIYPAMIYFIIINLLTLTISFNKKWVISTFLGLFLNIIGTFYITLTSIFFSDNGLLQLSVILYQLFVFFIYISIPLIGSYRTKIKLKKSDNVVFLINTVFSSLMMYLTFIAFGLEDYLGLSAIIFAFSYLLLGRTIEAKLKNEVLASKLFFQTGFTFVVLIIPFQFGITWLSLGWLVESVVISSYGILTKEKSFKKVGFVIASLCFASFLIFDLERFGTILFTYKYIAITIGNLVVLACFIYTKSLSGKYEIRYKYMSIVNIFLFMNYMINFELNDRLGGFAYDYSYLCTALSISLGFLIAYSLPRISVFADKGTQIISNAIYLIEILMLVILNTWGKPFPTESTILQTTLGSLILVIISLLSLLSLYDLIRFAVLKRLINIQFIPIILSLYLLFILTQNLINHYHLSFSNILISIFYVITSLFCIILGFNQKYPKLRRFGLGLSVLAVFKLFLIDLRGLTMGYQIISYFALGSTLVLISLVYQSFSKKLDIEEEVPENVK